MTIREMTEKDLDRVSAICIESFMESVAASLSEQGISTFKEIALSNAFSSRMQEDNMMLVSEEGNQLNGVIELKKGCHVAMLFVDPKHQNKGVGRKLISAALNHVRTDILTVKASLSSVPAYVKYGFECKGDTAESEGLIYQLMELELNKPTQPTVETSVN
ncbi:MAG: GNAT family N-acetyltransferase [Phycisphaerales bacterium]|nr:GNAT family N-acetyltransferase [Phycisphaerales bacterium]